MSLSCIIDCCRRSLGLMPLFHLSNPAGESFEAKLTNWNRQPVVMIATHARAQVLFAHGSGNLNAMFCCSCDHDYSILSLSGTTHNRHQRWNELMRLMYDAVLPYNSSLFMIVTHLRTHLAAHGLLLTCIWLDVHFHLAVLEKAKQVARMPRDVWEN